jgi:UDP-3-O-[3-hydroxymyristoyl] glucosamine N-acyltransferase
MPGRRGAAQGRGCRSLAGNALIVPDPYLAYARISHLFDPNPRLWREFIPAPW